MARKANNYVDNKKLYEAIKEYRKLCYEADDSGEEHPPVTPYIGECFMEMSKGMARNKNFSGYSYIDDMILDGVENSLKYILSFDPEKSNNPFSFFSQGIYYAFLRRIAKEKKELYIKYKASRQGVLGDTFSGDGEFADMNIDSAYTEHVDQYIKDYEDKMQKKK